MAKQSLTHSTNTFENEPEKQSSCRACAESVVGRESPHHREPRLPNVDLLLVGSAAQ